MHYIYASPLLLMTDVNCGNLTEISKLAQDFKSYDG